MEKTCNNLAFISKERAKNFKPYLFVETHFVHKKEMIMVLSMTENQRRLVISEAALKQAENIKKLIIGEVCATHYKARGKSLVIWGDIQSYKFFYKKDHAWLFDVGGNFVADIVEKEPETASNWTLDEKGNKQRLRYEIT